MNLIFSPISKTMEVRKMKLAGRIIPKPYRRFFFAFRASHQVIDAPSKMTRVEPENRPS